MVKFHSDEFLNLGIFLACSPIGRRSWGNKDHLDSSGVMFRGSGKLRVFQLPLADLVAVHRGAGRGGGDGSDREGSPIKRSLARCFTGCQAGGVMLSVQHSALSYQPSPHPLFTAEAPFVLPPKDSRVHSGRGENL